VATTSGEGPLSGDNIVNLRAEPVVTEPPAKSKPLSRLHGVATAGMALCAFAGIFSLLALITVRWPGNSNRYAMAMFVTSGLGLLLCCCIAVFSAARDTYARNGASVTHEEQE
jgi:hypothetical protein